MITRRRRSAITLTLMLVMPIALVQACGPDWEPDVFVRTTRPDDVHAFATGRLGILQTGFDSNELAVAYRYLNGGKLSEKERLAYAPPLQPVRDWSKMTAAQVEEAREAGSATLPIHRWRTARAKYLPKDTQAAPKVTLPENYGEYYDYDPNERRCGNPAFETAALTLNSRAATWGKESLWLTDWIRAQDAVFANCAGKASATPNSVPDGSPALLRADRVYQDAAAAFYAGRLDEAGEGFEAVARDHESPWRHLGEYLEARALVRKAFAMGKPTDPWSTDVADFDRKTMQAAQALLEGLLKKHDPALSRQTILNELNFVRMRTEPDKRVAEICAALEGPGTDDSFGQDLKDLNYVLLKHIEIKDPPPLLDWVRGLRAQGSAENAFAAWQKDHTLPWLVVALMKAEPLNPSVPDLLVAAAKIKPGEPAYDTVAFHRIRLLTESHREEEARSLLDQILPTLRGEMLSSRRNAFLGERMAVARSFDEFLEFAPRTMLEGSSEAAMTMMWECNGGRPLNRAPNPCPLHEHPLEFDEDAVLVLDRQTPLLSLVEATRSANLPPNLRQDVVLAAWTRSVVMADEKSAATLAPMLPEPLRRTAGTGVAFPAVFTLLRNPGLRPFVEPGVSRLVAYDYLDHFRNNWWCGDEWGGQFKEDPWKGPEPQPISFLSREQQAVARAEYELLMQLPNAPAYLGRRVLDYAKEHPEDVDVPEALALTVRATHYACYGWGASAQGAQSADSKNAAVDNTAVSKAAFQLLHSRYPKSPWAAKTRYYY